MRIAEVSHLKTMVLLVLFSVNLPLSSFLTESLTNEPALQEETERAVN